MKRVTGQLKSIAKTLGTLAKKVETITKQVEQAQAVKPAPVKKAAAKKTVPVKKAPAKKTASSKQTTVLETVFNAIKRTKKGITIPKIKEKTGLESKQLSNALFKLTQKGLIETKSRGVYIKK